MTGLNVAVWVIGIFLALALALKIIGKLQGKYHLIQYLYFLRVPIGAAILFASFPLVLIWEPTEQFARNWFDLDVVGFSVVTFLSLLLAWVIMNKYLMTYLLTAPRNHLVLKRDAQQRAKKSDSDKSDNDSKKTSSYKNEECPCFERTWGPFSVRFVVFSLLAVPLVATCFFQSSIGTLKQLGGIAIGLASALLLWAAWQIWFQERLVAHIHQRLSGEPNNVMSKLREWLIAWTSESFVDALFQGYGEHSGDIGKARLSAWLFFLITYGAYLGAYFLLSPANFPEWTERMPALGYVLLLLILVVWLLPTITLFLDKFRIPTLTSILFISFIVTNLFGSDYFYELIPPESETIMEDAPTPTKAYQSWQRKHPDYDRAIIITASGGGITAAFWTSLVITELERALGTDFSSSVLLLSSTSGGSVGAMYTIAQYGPNGLRQGALDEIVDDSGSSSIGAVAWGLIFPDFWRTVLGYSPLKDRAWAQEQIWQHYLAESDDDGPVMMSSWRPGIADGWRPAVVFNATIAETGEQLFISPINFFPDNPALKCDEDPDEEAEPRARGLLDLYPGSDIRVTTAARLSAAFPIVTPTARPKLPSDCKWVPFHVGDGGYYDNYGVLAAVEYLKQVLPEAKGKLRRIMVLQIRAADTKIKLEARSTTGAVGDVFAPLETMYNVRSASQVVNNDNLLEMLKDRWSAMTEKNRISIEPLVISLDKDSPLSWYLSRKDKCAILSAWDKIRKDKTDSVAQFLGTTMKADGPRLRAREDCEEF